MITKKYLHKLKKVNFEKKLNAKINSHVYLMPNQRKITMRKDCEFYYTKEPNVKNSNGEMEWVGIYAASLLKFYNEVK